MASAKTTNPQTFNRYSYVLNNPYKLVDPSGLESEEVDQAFAHLGELADEAEAIRQAEEDAAREAAQRQQQQQPQITPTNMDNVTLPEGPKSTPAPLKKNLVDDSEPAPYEGFSAKQILQAQTLRRYIEKSSVGRFVTEYSFNLDRNGKVQVNLGLSDYKTAIATLEKDKEHFLEAGLGFEHVGELGESVNDNVADFRSYTQGKDRLGPDSLQIDIGRTTGNARADIDETNFKQDVAGAVVHSGEYVGNKVKNFFKNIFKKN
jgi:hypothetical protein